MSRVSEAVAEVFESYADDITITSGTLTRILDKLLADGAVPGETSPHAPDEAEATHRIVEDILGDLLDRSGLGDAFEGIDEATQEEIRAAWIKIVLRHW